MKFKAPSKTIVISNLISDLDEVDVIIDNFKRKGIQPGVFIQHSHKNREEVFAIDYDDLINSLEQENIFISSAKRAEDITAGSTLGNSYKKLQEYGLTIDIGDNDRKIILTYDPELKHLHSTEVDINWDR